jgi:hypothetical protein
VEKAVARHRDCLKETGQEQEPTAGEEPAADLQQAAAAAAQQRGADSVLARRTRERYEQVQALRAQGKGIKPVMRETGLAKETVRRFYRAGSADELLAKIKGDRPSVLDEYTPYLHQRWNEGCTNVRRLHAELRDRGYRGSYGTVRGYVQPFRELGAAPPAVPAPPKARDVASWISRTRTPLMTTRKQSSRRPGNAARTWAPSPGTSPSSPRSSPAATATALMTGSPPSKQMTSPTCTPSPAGSDTTTTPCATA